MRFFPDTGLNSTMTFSAIIIFLDLSLALLPEGRHDDEGQFKGGREGRGGEGSREGRGEHSPRFTRKTPGSGDALGNVTRHSWSSWLRIGHKRKRHFT